VTATFVITVQDPYSMLAQEMLLAHSHEIRKRYELPSFRGISPESFCVPRSGFWIALLGDKPIGSVGLKPFSQHIAELSGMYVSPDYRRAGVAQSLMQALENHARQQAFIAVRLRAGGPQPEAVRFYGKMGFLPIVRYGQWSDDDTAWCFEKAL
jgi:GNAT superfamily N-acetyltransferase